ncbi:MAG: T9SS type A sorting domain-containing protein [Gemmatimonadota bacterium]|nr:MAG: T9SS type A sorting domain-containing protein [Gemmatimonadota bacterium]
MKMRSLWWVFCVVLLSKISFASESRIDLVAVHSQALGISKNVNIYLPEDYDENVGELYPVVYLFRGHEREWANRNEDASRNGRNIQDVADALYEAGLIGKMILVMPGVASDDNSVPGLGVNFVDVGLAGQKSGLGTGLFEDFLVHDLVPYIDEQYRTIPSRSQRGVDGFSLGGYTSMLMAAKHPDLFSSAGAYDGTMMWMDFDDPRFPGPNDDNTWLRVDMFDPAFGVPRDIDVMLQYNPANLIRATGAEQLALLQSSQFLIHSAGSEALGNLDRSQHIVDILAAQGVQNVFSDIRLASNAQHNWWYADEHMRVTLPLHWEKFANPVNTIPLEIMTPVPGSELSGTVAITWAPRIQDETTLTILSYSRDEGTLWHTLASFTTGDTTLLWNTEHVPDGTRYLLRVFITGETVVAVSQTDGRFTIDNPGNGAPDIEILSPDQWDVLSGEWVVRWFADDADGDELTLSLDYSWDDGAHWNPLFRDLHNTDEYIWNTTRFANSRNCLLAFYCSDDSVTVSDTSAVFEVSNERDLLPAEGMHHVRGNSSAVIVAHIVDPEQLTGDIYRITFNDTLFDYTVYDVINVDTGEEVVEGATELNGVTEGPLFDGLRLQIKDFERAEINRDSTGWRTGSSTLEITVHLPEIDIGTEILNGIPYPADYRISISDNVVDTSSSAFGAAEMEMMFTVWNMTENKREDVIFLDFDQNRTISRLDELFILLPCDGEPQLTWAVYFGGQPTAVNPQPGDEFVIRTLKPLTGEDVYEFRAGQDVLLCSLHGDANEDGAVDIMDVVSMVNFILGSSPDPFNIICADCDGDGDVNVLDALGIVNVILGVGECVPGAWRVSLLPGTMDFLTSLQVYLSEQEYARFMALVKATLFPATYHLGQNYPNPFNPKTAIEYTLPYASRVKLSVYNILGQEVRILVDGKREAGFHTVTFDGRDLASGAYFYRIKVGDFVATKRMLLLR